MCATSRAHNFFITADTRQRISKTCARSPVLDVPGAALGWLFEVVSRATDRGCVSEFLGDHPEGVPETDDQLHHYDVGGRPERRLLLMAAFGVACVLSVIVANGCSGS